MEFTAVFPLVKRAVEFTGWLDRSNIAYEQKGRTVTQIFHDGEFATHVFRHEFH